MMKMTYATRSCELAIADDCRFRFDVPCSYEDCTIRYAVCRFFSKAGVLQRDCTYKSWQKRLRSGKKSRKALRFSYIVPAAVLELPGAWAQISGTIDAVGVTVRYLKLSNNHPASIQFPRS